MHRRSRRCQARLLNIKVGRRRRRPLCPLEHLLVPAPPATTVAAVIPSSPPGSPPGSALPPMGLGLELLSEEEILVAAAVEVEVARRGGRRRVTLPLSLPLLLRRLRLLLTGRVLLRWPLLLPLPLWIHVSGSAAANEVSVERRHFRDWVHHGEDRGYRVPDKPPGWVGASVVSQKEGSQEDQKRSRGTCKG